MIWRITGYFFLFDLFVAVILFTFGVHEVTFDNNYMSLLRTCVQYVEPYKLEIPSIPKIPSFSTPQGIMVVVNFFVAVINGIAGIINFVILVLNLVINMYTYIVVFLSAFVLWLQQLGADVGFIALV